MGPGKTRAMVAWLTVVAALIGGSSGSLGAARRPDRLAVNRAAAWAAARDTIDRLPLPRGAVRVSTEPGGDHGLLSSNRQQVDPDAAHVRLIAWWTVRRSTKAVLRYVGNHPSPGAFQNETGDGQGPAGTVRWLGFRWPFPGHGIASRHLTVTVTQLADGRTGVQASVNVEWVVPRPASEVVPTGVHSVLLTLVRPGHGGHAGPTTKVTINASRIVQRAIRMVDSLPAEQPIRLPCAELPITYRCPADPAGPGSLSISFAAHPGGPALAAARVGIPVGWAYTGVIGDPIRFWVHGRPAHALSSKAFVRKALALVGLRAG